MNHPRTGPAVALLSIALIGGQIALMQTLAQAQWSHFAHMVIAVAMLGFGASGTWLAVAGNRMLQNHGYWVPLSMALAAVGLSLAPFLAAAPELRFDMMELFMGGARHWKLIFTYLSFFLPFFFGALAIGLSLAAQPGGIASLYAWNLAGSALGGPLALVLLTFMPAASVNSGLALAAWTAAGMCGLLNRARYLGIFLGLICLAGLAWPPQVKPSAYKDLALALEMPQRSVEGPWPSPWGEVRLVHSPVMRYAPALSLNYRQEPPAAPALFVNGDAYGVLLPPPLPGQAHILDATPRGLPYALVQPRKVLILEAGAGVDVTHALFHDTAETTAVEKHPIVRRLAAANSTGHLLNGSLAWMPGTARAWLAGNRSGLKQDGYDLVIMPVAGEFGGDSGRRALEENYIFSREALQQVWNRTSPGGMISAAAWIDYPPRIPLRLAVLLADSIIGRGIEDLPSHLLLMRNWAQLVFIASLEPFSREILERAREFAELHGFDLITASNEERPGLSESHHSLEDRALLLGLQKIMAGKIAEVQSDYPFDLVVPTDNRPYFNQFLRLAEWPAYRRLFIESGSPFMEIGLPLLFLTFIQIAGLSLVLIVLPLLRLGRRARGFGRPFLYFGAVGCGFMCWEIIMIQRFTLYWGHPLMAAAGVISILLLGMGSGSLYSAALKAERIQAGRVCLLLALLLLFYILLLPVFFRATLGFSLVWRGLLGIMVLLPPAFLMGMPFPLGLRWVEEPSRTRIAWAWGLDGVSSVISASGAALLAVTFGFNLPMGLAVLAYTLAGLATLGRGK